MKVKVKICGIRSLKAAQAAIDAGADFLGFNFVLSSQRYIDPSKALEIIKLIRGKTRLVGVFQNADLKNVNVMAVNLGLDLVQLHGNEDNEYISKVTKPVIKSVSLSKRIQRIKAAYFLLDRIKRSRGEMVNLKKAAQLAINFPIFFAGGLNSDNVASIIARVRPQAVDVASGVETNGEQNLEKIRMFIRNAKGVKI